MLSYVWSDTRYLPTLVKRCSIVSLCWPHSLHSLHLASPVAAFHDFVSTICSSIVITEAVFLGVRFCLSHKLQLSSCFRNILLCICLSRYSFSVSAQRFSLTLSLLLSMLVSSLFESFLHPVRCNLLQNLTSSPLHALT